MYARPETRNQDFDELVRSRYGLPPELPQRACATRTVTMSADTGVEVIPQPAVAPVPPADFTEYVVDREPTPVIPLPDPPAVTLPAAPPTTDPVAPPAGLPVAGPPSAPPSTGQLPPQPPSAEPLPVVPPATEPMPVHPAPGSQDPLPVAPPPVVPAAGPAGGPVTSNDLAADMQAILSGGKVYDPAAGVLRDRADLGTPYQPAGQSPRPQQAPRQPQPQAAPMSAGELPLPEAPNEQSIFDRIAKSMEYANSFDLGTVELGRFDQFDRVSEARRTAPPTATSAPAAARSVGRSAFIADLDAIDRERIGNGMAPADFRSVYHQEGPWSTIRGREPGCGGSALAMTAAPERAVAMYDTGEHVLTAGDLYPDQLRVGTGNGVTFSYGQILSMPDFYESVDQMLAADPAELSRLKALIERNTTYYRDHQRDPNGDVANAEWDTATGGRYLRLAEDNYSHFSPPAALGMTDTIREADNRSAWQQHHERAIQEMQQLVLASPNSTPIPIGPMTTNAFGDHFLTDAFASGHLVNKEVVINRFKAGFFTGANLNAAGQAFFGRVADKAFTGRLEERFSQLETEAYPLCAWGWCIPWRANINSVSRFTELLVQAAESEPVKIANVAVKAVHDQLNKVGVQVTNDAGDPAWTLTGDGHMNDTSLAIMRRAVQQSVDNINDPVILATNVNTGPLFTRVWRHVPKPTPAGRAQVVGAIGTFTDPGSAMLVDAAAAILTQQLDSLITVLLASGKLRRA